MDRDDTFIRVICISIYVFPYIYLCLAYYCNSQVFKNEKYDFYIFIAYLITAFAGLIYLFTSGAR